MTREVPEQTPFATIDDMPPPMRAMIFDALDRMAADPQMRRVRAAAQRALDPRPGQRLLDAGCGLGEVARDLAAAVAPGGDVVGLDASAAAIAVARERAGDAPVSFAVGDVLSLEFEDQTFDGVRAERVLQHIGAPDAAVAELVRVTRAGGRVCLVDTDWHSLASDGLPEEMVTRMWQGATVARQHQPTMGRTLRRRLVRAGLVDVVCEPVPLWFTDPDDASTVIPIFNRGIPREAGFIPDELWDPWWSAVDRATEAGELLAVVTIWVAAGVRP
jgi:ubiquinone/menaquinone biosynthesis C-methylase UbiE